MDLLGLLSGHYVNKGEIVVLIGVDDFWPAYT